MSGKLYHLDVLYTHLPVPVSTDSASLSRCVTKATCNILILLRTIGKLAKLVGWRGHAVIVAPQARQTSGKQYHAISNSLTQLAHRLRGASVLADVPRLYTIFSGTSFRMRRGDVCS